MQEQRGWARVVTVSKQRIKCIEFPLRHVHTTTTPAQTKYRSRQNFANTRVRVKGRFVSKVTSAARPVPFPLPPILTCNILRSINAYPHLAYSILTSQSYLRVLYVPNHAFNVDESKYDPSDG